MLKNQNISCEKLCSKADNFKEAQNEYIEMQKHSKMLSFGATNFFRSSKNL